MGKYVRLFVFFRTVGNAHFEIPSFNRHLYARRGGPLCTYKSSPRHPHADATSHLTTNTHRHTLTHTHTHTLKYIHTHTYKYTHTHTNTRTRQFLIINHVGHFRFFSNSSSSPFTPVRVHLYKSLFFSMLFQWYIHTHAHTYINIYTRVCVYIGTYERYPPEFTTAIAPNLY